MNLTEWVEELTHLENADSRHRWLEAHPEALSVTFVLELKPHFDELLLAAPLHSLALAEMGMVVAARVPEWEALAAALWMRGNAYIQLGECARAVEDHARATQLYQEHAPEQYRLEIARLQTNQVTALKNLGRYQEALTLAGTAREALQPWGQSRYLATLEMNVGSCYRLLGRYEEALAVYGRGLEISAALGDAVLQAQLEINRARMLVMLDRFDEAGALLQTARDALAARGKVLQATRADLNRATWFSLQGQIRAALELYQSARAAFMALGVESDVATVDLYMAEDYLTLNLLPEAAELAATARDFFAGQNMPRYVALALGRKAIAVRKQGNYAEALALLEEAQTFFSARTTSVEWIGLQLERVLCLRGSGNIPAAVTLAGGLVEGLAARGLVFQAARARLVWADCLLAAGDLEAGAAQYTLAGQELGEFPALAWAVEAGLGRIAEAREELRPALEHYQAAIAMLEAVEAELGSAEWRAGFLTDKLDVYRRAVAVALALAELPIAFELAQQAKSGVWRAELMRTASTDATVEELRRRWRWLYNRLTRPDEDDETVSNQERGGIADGRYWGELRAVERALSEARRAIAGASALPHLNFTEIQSRLSEGVVVLDFYCTAESVAVFWIERGHLKGIADLVPLAIIERLVNRWQFHLESVRWALLEEGASGVDRLLPEGKALLQDFYAWLLAPLVGELGQGKAVWIIPHDLLWQVPFAALYDGEQHWMQRQILTCLPGWVSGERSAPVSKKDIAPLVVGCSDNGRLPHAVAEARMVAAVLEASERLLLEDAATVTAVEQAAANSSLIHWATHGLFRADAPLFSALHFADDWLTAADLERWDLSGAALITLSACETGISLSRGSDLLGLPRALWRAGARKLLVSLWPVDDASTAELMEGFYRSWRCGSQVADALRAAQQSVLTTHPHPFYWAGFTVMEIA